MFIASRQAGLVILTNGSDIDNRPD